MTALRRFARPEIRDAAARVVQALEVARVELDRKNTSIAMLVLAVEQLEGAHTHEQLRKFFDRILTQPLPIDPRADTRGT